MKGFGEQYKSNKANKKNIQLSKEQIIYQAVKFHSQGNISEATKYYQYFINQGFKDHRVFSNYGIILRDLGKLKEAEFSYRKAIKIEPNYAEAHYNLGNILLGLGKLKEAELSYRKAIELKPNYAQAHSNLGIILRNIGKLKEAELSLRKAIESKPDYSEAYSNLATILKDLDQLEEAELILRKAIELKPDFTIAYSNLGTILKDLDQLEEAELILRKAIELKPDFADAYLTLGMILKDLDQLEEAELSTRKAIELKPDYAEAHSNLGNILRDVDKLEEAELSTLKAIELKPDFADAYLNLGIIMMDLRKLEKAEIMTKKAIELKPDFALSHIKLGEILFDLGKLEESRIYEWNAVKISTSSIHLQSYINKAKVIRKTAFWVFSCSIFNQYKPVIDVDPDSFEVLVPNDNNKMIIQKIRNDLKNKDIRIRSINELLENNLIYEKLVSNRGDDKFEYFLNKNNIQKKVIVPLIKLLGQKNIKFMYTAGKNQYTINSYWNKYYDGILCYGSYHEDKFKIKHKIATSQMGYPRFDKYFKPGFERDYLIKYFKCNPKKKTIVWLPTWTSLSSIDKYYKAISLLRIDYNVVVRPHPSFKAFDPEIYSKLFNTSFNYIDEKGDNDNVQLYALADLMLFDYGGPMFGALYLKKNFAFLEMDLEAKKHYGYLGSISSEDYFKSFFPDRIIKLDNLKEKCTYCLKYNPSVSTMNLLREEFFNINYLGSSANKACDLLNDNTWLN